MTTTTEQTFRDAWLEAIGRDDGYLAIRRTAFAYAVDPDDLVQDVAEWFISNADDLEAKAIQAKVTENYIVKIINNHAKKLAMKEQANRFENTGQHIYTKSFIRKHKGELAQAQGKYTNVTSDAHAVYVDFECGISTLTEDELELFLTPPADYPEDEAENKRFRTRVSKLTEHVYRRMNDAKYKRGATDVER